MLQRLLYLKITYGFSLDKMIISFSWFSELKSIQCMQKILSFELIIGLWITGAAIFLRRTGAYQDY